MINNSFIKKTGVAFVCQALGLLYEFIIMVLAGQLLGAKGYGIVLYVYTILSICMIATKFGFENSIVSLMARKDITIEKKRWIVLFCISVSLTLSVIMIFVINIFKPTFVTIMGSGGGNYRILREMSPIIILETVGLLFASVLRGTKETFKYYIVYMHMQYGIRLLSFVILWYAFEIKTIYSLIISYYISCILMIFMALLFLHDMHLFKGDKEKESISFLFSLSIPLLLSSAITVINSEIDQFMIGYYLNDAKLAIYSMALNIGKIASFALVAVNSIFAPLISEYYYSDNIENLRHLYSRTTKWVVCFNAVVMGTVSICGRDVLSLIGDEYIVGYRVLVIILIGETVNSLVGSVGYLNSMTGKASHFLAANLIAVSVNVFLNRQMIPIYGIEGAAIASATAVIISNTLLFILMYKHLRIQPYTLKYLGIIIAFVFAFIPTALIHNIWNKSPIITVTTCVLLFCLTFGIMAYFLVCEENEKKIMKLYIGGLF